MSSIKKIALAGGSGALGAPVLRALLDAGFDVTVLTRAGTSHSFPSPAKVEAVDYNNVESLTKALQGHDAFVSTINSSAAGLQKIGVDAAIAAGVQRIIPSEFGCDLNNPKARLLPVFAPKVEVRAYVEKKTQGTPTTYTYITNCAFLDWGLDQRFFLDAVDKKVELTDGGDVKFTSTPLDFVSKGVVAVLQNPKETENRTIRLHGASVTQNQLLKYAQKHGSQDGWKLTHASSVELEKEAYENLKNNPGNVFGWVRGFLLRAIFGEGYGGHFGSDNDNQLLGLKELTEDEVEEIVKKSTA